MASLFKGVRTDVWQSNAPSYVTASQPSFGTGAIGRPSCISNAAVMMHASNGNGDNRGSLVVVVEGRGL